MVPPPLSRQQQDNRVLLVFAVFAVLGSAVPAAVVLLVEKNSGLQLIGSALSGLSSAFLVAGLLSFHYNRKKGLLPRRRVWLGSMVAAVVCAVVVVAILFVAYQYRPDVFQLPPSATENMGSVILALVFGFFVAAVFTFLVGFLLAFGGIGVMAAIGRKVTPWVLLQIASLDPSQRISSKDRVIRWLFDIPEVLDTRTLRMGPLSKSGKMRWSELKRAVCWELFFGVILAVYVSFNPFVSNGSPAALFAVFGILISGSVLIPLIILPWQVFRRLDARIKGVTKDFKLYDGIRSRLFQSYLAIGTIIILIRLSISTIDVQIYLLWFTAFVVVLLGISLVFTFVYFNYFEEELVENISSTYERNRETKTPQP